MLGMTRAELITRMSGSEFAYWVAYHILERRDEERALRRQRNNQYAMELSRQANRG
jgi:hypothetical protein